MRMFAEQFASRAAKWSSISRAFLCPNAGIGSTTDTSVLSLFPHRLALGLPSCLC